MRQQPFPPRHIAQILFSLLLLAACFACVYYLLHSNWLFGANAALGAAVLLVGLVAEGYGLRYGRHLAVLLLVLVVGGTLPEPFVSHEFSISIFVVPVLAGLLLGAGWIAGSLALTYSLLVLRGGPQTIYLEPLPLILTSLVGGGMALSRYLTDQARAATESALMLARQHQESARFQARLLEFIDQAVLAVDEQSKITYLNAAAERLYGWPAAEALGQDATLLFPQPGPEMIAAISAELTQGRSWAGEYRSRRRDGMPLLLLSTVSPILADDQRWLGGVVSVAQDISARQASAEALRASEERYRLLTEAIRDFICLLDAEGRFVYASPSYALLGYEPQALVGLPAFASVHPDDIAAVLTAWQRIAAGEVATVTFRFADSGGDWHWFDASGTPFVWQGQAVGLIAGHDITARVQAEAARQQLQGQLEQAQRLESIGRLAGGIAHDINNLLTVIIGHADLGRQDCPPGSTFAADFEVIFSVSQRASQLTRGVLAFARRQLLTPKTVSLNALIVDLNRLLQRVIGEDIELVILLDDDLTAVNVDVAQIEQVLVNLAVNARDAMPKGGKLTIQTSGLAIAEHSSGPYDLPPGSYAQLRVSDTGVGIAPEVLGQIFEPFFTTKDPGKGTGLGLAMVYGIVSQHGGAITAASVLGQGSSFTIALPCTTSAVEVGAVLSPLAAAHGSETILLVEDESSLRALIARTLRVYGYSVVEASNGDEALRVLERHGRPDLIVSDLVMPLMGGIELVGHTATLMPGLPVLFISGYSDDAVLPGDAVVLHKPFTPATLARAVRAVLDWP